MAHWALYVANSAFLLFSIPSVVHKPPNPGETQNLCQGNSVASMPPVDGIDDVLNTLIMVPTHFCSVESTIYAFPQNSSKEPHNTHCFHNAESVLATDNRWMMLTALPVALQYEGSFHWETCSQLSERGLGFSIMCLCSLALRSAWLLYSRTLTLTTNLSISVEVAPTVHRRHGFVFYPDEEGTARDPPVWVLCTPDHRLQEQDSCWLF